MKAKKRGCEKKRGNEKAFLALQEFLIFTLAFMRNLTRALAYNQITYCGKKGDTR